MTVNCATCGNAVDVGTRFCHLCGAPTAPPARAFCTACGLELQPGTRFCSGCGAVAGAAAPSTVAPGPNRAPSGRPRGLTPALAGVLLLASVGVAVAIAAGVFPIGGMLGIAGAPSSPNAGQPLKLSFTDDGQPMRPQTVVRSQDGAVADVPAGPYRYSPEVQIRQIDAPKDDRRWELEGGWQFTSKAGTMLEQPVTIDLPVRGAAADAKAVVLTVDARWIELPAEQAKLANGSPALRVKLSDVPTPWVVGVARQRPGAPKEGELSRLERLYWTDRPQWETEARDWLTKARTQASGPSVGVAVARPQGLAAPLPARTWVDAQKDLDWALKTLGAAKLGQGGKAGASPPMAPAAAYEAGIDKLFAVRQEWVSNREAWGRDAGGRDQLLFDDEQTMDQALETGLATYAPWGVEFTRFLLKSEALKGMNLDVIYGEAYYTDVPVAKGAVKLMEDAITNAIGDKSVGDSKKIKPGTESVNRYLRLYSKRAVEETSLIDYLKDWKTQAFFRYLPAVLAATGLVSGGTSLVVAIAVDEVINQWQNMYEETETPYVYAQLEAAGVTAAGASLYMDATQQFLRSTFHEPVDLADVHGTRLGAVQFAYGAALAFAVANTDWYMLKDVRAMTEGSQSYCIKNSCNWLYSQVIPPIQLLAAVKGDLAGQPADAYPTTVATFMSWTFDTGFLPNLHQLLEEGKPETLASAVGWMREDPKGGLKNMGFSAYKKDLWPLTLVRSAPQAQALRIALPKEALKLVGAAYGLSESTPLSGYGLVLRLEQANGKRNIFEIANEMPTPPGGDSSKIYTAVVLRSGDLDELTGVPGDYSGPQQKVDGGLLIRELRARLTLGGDDVLWEGAVRFGPRDKMVQADADDVESPRIHLKEIAADFSGRPSIRSITPSPVWYEEEITLSGTGFGAAIGNGRVIFYAPGRTQGIIVTPTSWSDKVIKVKVPRGVLDVDRSKEPLGTVEVMVRVPNPKGPATEETNRAEFQIGTPKPRVTAIAPAKAMLDAEVTITGQGFGATQGSGTVTFKERIERQVVSWSDTAIKIKVPRGPVSGDVVVTVGGAKSDPVRFDVDYFAHLKTMSRMSLRIEEAKLIYEEDLSGTKRPGGAAGLSAELQLDASTMIWKGNSFTATFSGSRNDGWGVNHTVSGTFDESGGLLLEATLNTSAEHVIGQGMPTLTQKTRFKASNLPLVSILPAGLNYELKGPAVANSVSGLADEIAQSDGKYTRTFRSADWGATQPRVSLSFGQR